MDGEIKGEGEFCHSVLFIIKHRCEVALSPDEQGQVSNSWFSYHKKQLCNDAKHVLWGGRLRIIRYAELFWLYGNVKAELHFRTAE